MSLVTTDKAVNDQKQKIELLNKVVSELEHEFQQIKSRISEAKIERNNALQQLSKMEAQLQKKPDQLDIRVTDHAVIRYMERVLQFNVESVRQSILTERNKKMIEFARDCRIKHDGVELVVKNGAVTTVLAAGEDLK